MQEDHEASEREIAFLKSTIERHNSESSRAFAVVVECRTIAHYPSHTEDDQEMQKIHSLETQVADLEAQLDMAQQETATTKRENDKALAEMRRQMERALYEG